MRIRTPLIATLFQPDEPFHQGDATDAPREVARAFAEKLTMLGPCAACILESESGGRLRLDYSRASLGRLETWLLETLVLVRTGTKAQALRNARTKVQRDRIELIVKDVDFLRLEDRSVAIAVFVGLYFFKCLEKKGGNWTWHFENKLRDNRNQLVVLPSVTSVVDLGVNCCSRIARRDEQDALQKTFDWYCELMIPKK